MFVDKIYKKADFLSLEIERSGSMEAWRMTFWRVFLIIEKKNLQNGYDEVFST